jgi:hypothetical protein
MLHIDQYGLKNRHFNRTEMFLEMFHVMLALAAIDGTLGASSRREAAARPDDEDEISQPGAWTRALCGPAIDAARAGRWARLSPVYAGSPGRRGVVGRTAWA